MELCSGGSLADQLDAFKRIPVNVLRSHVTQILNGLSYLHSNFVSHRDLKPQNVLVAASAQGDVIKLADFGCCKILDAETQTGTENMGTPACVRQAMRFLLVLCSA